MSLYNFFRNIFGFPRRTDEEDPFRSENYNYPEHERHTWRNDYYEDDDIEEMEPLEEQPFGFKIFSSPHEIHQFFEKQMDDILKTFKMFESDHFFGIGDFPSIEPPDDGGQRTGTSLRDELFKPGYQYRRRGIKGSLEDRKEDNDLDESIKGSSLEQILDGKSPLDIDVPDRLLPSPGVQTRIFGKTLTSKTIRRPDGSLEHHKTVKDNQGNEETTITRQMGDKKYTVITQTDSSGVVKKSETFQNVDEGEMEEFKKKLSLRPEMENQTINDGVDFRKFFNF